MLNHSPYLGEAPARFDARSVALPYRAGRAVDVVDAGMMRRASLGPTAVSEHRKLSNSVTSVPPSFDNTARLG